MMMGGGHGREMAFQVEVSKPKSVGTTLARFWQYFKQYKLTLLLVISLIILGTYMQVLTPDLIGQAVDCYLTPATQRSAIQGTASVAPSNCWYTTPNPNLTNEELIGGLGGLILIIIGMYIGSSVIQGAQIYLMSYAGQNVLRSLRLQIFDHIHRLSLGYYTKHEAGDVMSRLTNDADTIQQVIGFPLIGTIQGLLLIIWIAFTMFSKSAVYALISLSISPLMLITTLWFSNQARKAYRQVRKTVGNVNAELQENIAAVREAQAFNREAENIEQFNEANKASRDATIRAVSYTSALSPALEALGYIAVAVIAGVGGLMLVSNSTLLGANLSLGLIVAFINYMQRFSEPIVRLSLFWANIQSAIAGGERIFGLLDTEPDLKDKPNARPMPTIGGRVAFENVVAEYEPGQPVLKSVNIAAESGQTIAIVGPTGAGKTTIINLIPRFYDVKSGAVRIDGIDVRDVTAQSLRQQIGIVLQDSFLFSDTIMNNIRYGRPDATDEEVIAAAKLARADTFIERLPEKYETKLGERGSGLSQGQRQLLSIARAALAQPRILILDEATSSVDTRTERLIQGALQELLHGRTSFVIAHRLSTIRHADQVLVLKDGEIIERGKHEELLKKRGFYHDLYMSQFRRDIDFSEESAAKEFAALPLAGK